MMLSIAFTIVLINIGICIFLVIAYQYGTSISGNKLDDLPYVSILIAVRDEASSIKSLLKSLKEQNYPKEKLEILIGDDQSSDATLNLLQKFRLQNVEIIEIQESRSHLRGKMNAMDQLIDRAKGNYLLFTDGDAVLNPNWTHEMVSAMSSNVGMVCGFTGVRGSSVFAGLQHADMIFFQGVLMTVYNLNSAISVIGNNLITDKQKIESLGGYASVNFSVVEDVALMNVLKKGGHEIKIVHNENTTIDIQAEDNCARLLNQRHRWAKAMEFVPIWLKLLFFVKLIFVPAILYLVQYYDWILLVFVLKITLSYFFFKKVSKRVNRRVSNWSLLLYEFYEPIVYLSTFVFSLLPIKIYWKGRSY